MASLLKIFRILPPQEYKACFFLFFLMLVSVSLETIGVGLILPFIAALGSEDFFSKYPVLAVFAEQVKNVEYNHFIILCAVGLIGFYFLKNLFLGFTNWMQIRFIVRNQNYYSRQLFAEYLYKPYIFHINSNMGVLLRNVNSGGAVVFGAVVLPLLNLIVECATAVSIWLLLMFVDPLIATLVSFFFGGLVAVVIKSFRGRIDRQGDLQKECQAQFLSWAGQGLGAIKVTKVMHTEDYFLDKFDASYRRYGEAMGSFQFLQQMPRLVIEGVVVSGLLLLVILKIFMGSSPNDIVPLMGLLALVAFRLMPSANRIVSYYNAIKFQMPFFHEIYPEFLAIRERCSEENWELPPSASKRFAFAHEICIDHVAFSYDGVHEVLKDVSLRIHRGDYVGIIGVSGVGKTTFVDVLLGLFQPTKGRITVDDLDVFSDIRGWQENLAYVPQSIILVDGSIKDNIALGQDAGSIDENFLEEVIRMAELYDFVRELPDGVETSVGDQGNRLSGGQRQRIGIARALYQRPEVLVLDEATSALDNATEKSIMDTILKLKGKMTIISIAHRMSTLDACDYKVRFYNGCCEILR